jgi:hypothetical protein
MMISFVDGKELSSSINVSGYHHVGFLDWHFVAMEDDALFLDDCQGMRDFFVAKYWISGNGDVCLIPRHACPSFPGQIEGFRKLWSIDSCELIFNSLRQIRQEMQRILCQVAQSQGDFAVKNAKLHHEYFWCPIQSSSLRVVMGSKLSCTTVYWGYLDVLRFDTIRKLLAFRALFGTMTGYGVRKKRPKYSDGRSRLCLNYVLNVVVCQHSGEDEKDDASTDSTVSNASSSQWFHYVLNVVVCQHSGEDEKDDANTDSTVSNASSSQRFQCFGATDDGIDLLYDLSQGMLQIVLRYRKVVVTHESLQSLVGVGVGVGVGVSRPEAASFHSTHPGTGINIVAGMQFMDGEHVMQVQEVHGSEIRAKRMYRIDGARQVTATDVVIYSVKRNVYRKIQQMLE